jgi:hypothetical protein
MRATSQLTTSKPIPSQQAPQSMTNIQTQQRIQENKTQSSSAMKNKVGTVSGVTSNVSNFVLPTSMIQSG